MKLYLVGGAVRDMQLGVPIKDLDFAVEATSFEDMLTGLKEKYDLRVWLSRPEFVSIRGQIRLPQGQFRLTNTTPAFEWVHADFTLCRQERMYHDKRHPSEVTPTDLLTDLSRRDYTINAMALTESGDLIDPHRGSFDLSHRNLHMIGNAQDRYDEDPLRILRGIRYVVNNKFFPGTEVHDAWKTKRIVDMLRTVPIERVRDELARTRDWYTLMKVLVEGYPLIGGALRFYFPRLRFKPTLEA